MERLLPARRFFFPNTYGQVRGSFYFPGGTRTLYRTTKLPLFGSLTTMFWVQRRAESANRQILWYYANSTAFNTFLGCFADSANNLTIDGDAGGARTTLATGALLQLGAWYHIAITFEVTGRVLAAYVNGTLVGSDTVAGTTPVWGLETLGNTSSGSGQATNGNFAALKSWTRVLTPGEIRLEANTLVPVRLYRLHRWTPLTHAADMRDWNGTVDWRPTGVMGTGVPPPIVWTPRSRRPPPPRTPSGATTLTVSPARLATVTPLASQTRTWRVTTPGSVAWRAPALTLGRTVQAVASQSALASPVPTGVRSVSARPAAQAMQAATRALTLLGRATAWATHGSAPSLTRTIVGTPGRMAWQAATRALTLTTRPAGWAWLASTAVVERILSVQSSRLAAVATTALLGRSLPVSPAQQASVARSATVVTGQLRMAPACFALAPASATLTRSSTVSPSRMALQAPTRALTLLAHPSRLEWQAATGTALSGAVVFTVTPSRVEWAAATRALTLLARPSRAAWQAATALPVAGTIVFVVTAAQWAWTAATATAEAQVGTQSLTGTPAHQAWQAATAPMTRGLATLPSRMATQAPVASQTRTLSVLVAALAWHAPTGRLGRTQAVTPTRLAWQAPAVHVPRTAMVTAARFGMHTPSLTVLAGSTVAVATPAQLAWRAPTRALTFLGRPGQMALGASTALLGRLITTQASRYAGRAATARLTQVLTVSPALDAWEAPRALASRRILVTGARSALAAATALLGRPLTVLPSRMAWKAATNVLGRSLTGRPGGWAWQTTTALHTRSVTVQASQRAWRAAMGSLGRSLASRATHQAWQAGRGTLGREILALTLPMGLHASTPRHTRTMRIPPAAYQMTAVVAILGGSSVTTALVMEPAVLAWHVASAEAALRPTITHRHGPVFLAVMTRHSAHMGPIHTHPSAQTGGIQTQHGVTRPQIQTQAAGMVRHIITRAETVTLASG